MKIKETKKTKTSELLLIKYIENTKLFLVLLFDMTNAILCKRDSSQLIDNNW